jgi:ribonuclease P protein subunit RPR2
MKNLKRKMRDEQKDIAAERVSILFEQAESAAKAKDFEKADAHVRQARDIAMKSNLKMRKEQRRMFCGSCFAYLLPSVSSKVRINSDEKRVEVKCLRCGKAMYYPYVREVKEKRRKKK